MKVSLLLAISTLLLGASAVWAQASSDEIKCDRATGPTIELGQAKLFLNTTAQIKIPVFMALSTHPALQSCASTIQVDDRSLQSNPRGNC